MPVKNTVNTPNTAKRAGRSLGSIHPERLAQLNAGAASCTDLTECLAVDFAALMQAVLPALNKNVLAAMQQAAGSGITRRMALAGTLLYEALGVEGFERLREHPSDTLRGWACYLLAAWPDLTMAERLQRIKPLADDPHFGVREWAWLALRPMLAADLPAALALLQPWTQAPSERVRRYACESLRPRGVWCSHIAALKKEPEPGLLLLEPLKADPAVYVQDSVANWLNDASKDRPDWVRAVCARWLQGEEGHEEGHLPAATQRICKRALRSIGT